VAQITLSLLVTTRVQEDVASEPKADGETSSGQWTTCVSIFQPCLHFEANSTLTNDSEKKRKEKKRKFGKKRLLTHARQS
jgi:hypothetical protein